jgi:hypothetical protein
MPVLPRSCQRIACRRRIVEEVRFVSPIISQIPHSLRRWWTACLTVALLLVSGVAQAVDVVDVRWGFDGKVVRNRFNILTILVNNPRPDAFDGELVLQKQMSGGQDIDAPVVENVFVGPFGETKVQFYPYIGNEWEEWELEIRPTKGRRGAAMKLNSAKTGWPARVMIEAAQNPVKRTLPVKRLPEAFFPPFVTATDALQAVLFDAPPNWDEPRRQAFLDWLYRGGTAYVLNDVTGNAPLFPAALGVLNSPLDVSTYGAGRVIRTPLTRAELSKESLTRVFATLPKRLVQERDDGELKELSVIDDEEESDQQPVNRYADSSDPLSGSSFLSRLRNMTQPKHNWALLHLLFWTYIGLVFPGSYLMGRKWSDYRVVYLSLIGVVVVFSLLFGLVGQRGYGEATAVHSVAIVRPLADGQADVSQWSNAFVTMGGDYEFRHAGAGGLYSSCNFSEAVIGTIRNGAEAEFGVDIPPFSSREFAHRVKLKLALPQLLVDTVSVEGDQLKALTITTDAAFPKNTELIVALYHNRFYSINRVADRLELGSAHGTAAGYLRVQEFQNYQYQYGPRFGASDRPVMEQFRDVFTPLIARSLSVSRMGDAEALIVPPHVVRLFYFGPMTPEFAAQSRYLGRQEGWVLYAVDVPVTPENAPP